MKARETAGAKHPEMHANLELSKENYSPEDARERGQEKPCVDVEVEENGEC